MVYETKVSSKQHKLNRQSIKPSDQSLGAISSILNGGNFIFAGNLCKLLMSILIARNENCTEFVES